MGVVYDLRQSIEVVDRARPQVGEIADDLDGEGVECRRGVPLADAGEIFCDEPVAQASEGPAVAGFGNQRVAVQGSQPTVWNIVRVGMEPPIALV